jgi:cytochrome oxidase assembly protein ShyY1
VSEIVFLVEGESVLKVIEFEFKHGYLLGLVPFINDYNPHTNKQNHYEYSVQWFGHCYALIIFE